MASSSGFLRKSPPVRLQQFFTERRVRFPQDFDWKSDGRGTGFVRSIEAVLSELPDLQQDGIKAELDLLSSLSDTDGMTSAEQICAGDGIELEGLEGVEDTLLMLAITRPQLIDRVSAQASLIRRTGGRNWSAFQFDDDGKPWSLEDDAARSGFLTETISILDVPQHRKREADWYKTVKTDPITGEETEIVHATIYVEARAESELAFGVSNTLDRQLVQKVMEVGIACDAKARIVEICAKGGKKVRDEYVASFAKHFAPQSETPVETPRRNVMLDTLKSPKSFLTEPSDGIERVEVSSLDFFSTGGGFTRVEKRGDNETIYQFLDRKFGRFSPLSSSGWHMTGATVRIIVAANEDQRRHTLTVTLRTPNTTTLPNKTERDRQFVFDLLERWNLLAPRPKDHESFEVVD